MPAVNGIAWCVGQDIRIVIYSKHNLAIANLIKKQLDFS